MTILKMAIVILFCSQMLLCSAQTAENEQLPIIRISDSLSNIFEQFHLDPSDGLSDAPYYDSIRSTPMELHDPPIPESISLYSQYMQDSGGNFILFGQGGHILQLLFANHTIRAVQIRCAMHCSLATEPNLTYQVTVVVNDEKHELMEAGKSLPAVAYAAAIPLKIMVNLGDKAESEKAWQHLVLKFIPLQEKYQLAYWRS